MPVPRRKSKEQKRREKNAFPFMKLPSEIRNRIYELAVVDTEVISPGIENAYIYNVYNHHIEGCQCTPCKFIMDQDHMQLFITKRTATALKLVSRDVSRESAAIFFRENKFRMDSQYDFKHFLERINPIERQLMTKLKLSSFITNYGAKDLNLLRKCTGLKSLEVSFEDACRHSNFWDKSSCQWMVENNPPALKALLKLRGIAKFSIQADCDSIHNGGTCREVTELEAMIREHITKPRSEASIRAHLVYDTPELWKELKAEKENTNEAAHTCRKRKRVDE